jgi:glyoxylase-like metal-dependent hydrolase (beta-lactamase superfamily II)
MTVTRVHHLDCCTMCPRLGRVNSERTFVGHVLAVETERSGVILVDTGIGAAARANPERILGRGFTTMFRPDLDPDRSARRQLERLGLADEVRHVIVTHLDVDHAGGLSDFPGATVHVHRDELAAATRPGSLNERLRYRSILWDHVPRFEPFGPAGEAWFGFEAARQLRGLPDDLVAIPLPGHTRGHVAVAVGGPSGWLLHCGDAYFHHGAIRRGSAVPAANRRFERAVAADWKRVQRNHERLTALAEAHRPDVRLISAHDPDEFRELADPPA